MTTAEKLCLLQEIVERVNYLQDTNGFYDAVLSLKLNRLRKQLEEDQEKEQA